MLFSVIKVNCAKKNMDTVQLSVVVV